MIIQTQESCCGRHKGFGQFDPVSAAVMGATSLISAFKSSSYNDTLAKIAQWNAIQTGQEMYTTREIVINAVFPAIAIIGGILLLRKA